MRPLPESILNLRKCELEPHDWSSVYNAKTPNEKADIFKEDIMDIVNNVAPEKTINIASDDEPWFTE